MLGRSVLSRSFDGALDLECDGDTTTPDFMLSRSAAWKTSAAITISPKQPPSGGKAVLLLWPLRPVEIRCKTLVISPAITSTTPDTHILARMYPTIRPLGSTATYDNSGQVNAW